MSSNTDNSLPNDIAELKQLVIAQQQQLSEQHTRLKTQSADISLLDRALMKRDERIAELEERLALLKANRYGRSSEKLKDIQGELFDETELEQEIAALQEKLKAEAEAQDEADEDKPRRRRTQPRIRKVTSKNTQY